MSDVFISYSRADKDFVGDLQRALIDRGHDAWVDWQAIPPAAEFMQEIYSGIEAANTFVCILSPDYVASTYCSLEVAHAVECRKRLIPIVRRDVEPAGIHRDVAALNWIFFRSSDDFEAALSALLTALNTDLEYVKLGSRLLVRAREWDSRKGSEAVTHQVAEVEKTARWHVRLYSRLRAHIPEWITGNRADAAMLRGVELEEAERWLAQGANKTPSPTALEVEYITASRRAGAERQRRWLGGVSVALAVTIILSVVSFVLFQVAQTREQVAQTNFAHALARQLAAQSLNQVNGQRDLALLLAVEAYHRDPTNSEAADAMLTALETQPRLAGFVQDYVHKWVSVAFSPDGKELAAGSDDGTIMVWDVATRRLVGTPMVADSRDHGLVLVTFSPDGRLLGSTGSQMKLQIWDVRSHRLMAASPPLAASGTIAGIAFSPDSRQLAANTCVTSTDASVGTPAIGLWNLTSRTAAAVFPISGSYLCTPGGIAYSPDGARLAIGVYGGTFIWDTTTQTLVAGPLPTVNDVISPGATVAVDTLAFSPDGSLLAVGQCGHTAAHVESETYCLQGAIQLWNAATGQLIATLTGHTTDVTGLAFSPDGKELASASGDNSIILWNVDSHAALYQFDAHLAVTNQLVAHQIAFSPNGELLASASGSDLNVSLWNMTTAQPLATPLPSFADQPPHGGSPDDTFNEVNDVAISQNDKLLAAIGCTTASASGAPSSPSPSTSSTPTVWLWNPATRQQSGELRLDNSGVCGTHVAFSPDSRTAAFVVDTYQVDTDTTTSTVRLWQTITRRFIGQPWSASDQLDAVTFSPSGSLLAAGGCHSVTASGSSSSQDLGGEIWLRNVVTGRVSQLTWSRQAGCVEALAFSRDGSMLAAGVCLDRGAGSYPCHGSEVQIWDVVNRRPIGQPISLPLGDFDHVWFSPDGKTVAVHVGTNQAAGGTIFWDVASHRQTLTQPPTDYTTISGDWSLMASTACPSVVTGFGTCYGSEDLQLSDLQGGQPIGAPLAGDAADNAAALPPYTLAQSFLFAPDNKSIVSWTWGQGPTLLWDINPVSWANRICGMVGRNLTRDEWNRYLTASEPYHQTCSQLPPAP